MNSGIEDENSCLKSISYNQSSVEQIYMLTEFLDLSVGKLGAYALD
jgi:hypothetical protein